MPREPALIIRVLGQQDYTTTWRAMQDFTVQRNADSVDQLWWVEHPPTYTQGQAGNPAHLLGTSSISVVQSDRGGQITYHGPGQLIAYLLLDLRRRQLGIKTLVSQLEQAVIDLLAEFTITGTRQCGAPGVYTSAGKIAALGLRVKRHCCYHGLALNVAMDLTPFQHINPCGMQGLSVIDMQYFYPEVQYEAVRSSLQAHLCHQLGYTEDILAVQE